MILSEIKSLPGIYKLRICYDFIDNFPNAFSKSAFIQSIVSFKKLICREVLPPCGDYTRVDTRKNVIYDLVSRYNKI